MEFDPELQALIERFENNIKQGIVQYYDTDELETIIDCYLVASQYDQARIAIDYACRLHPNSEKIKCIEAKLYLLEEKYVEATKILESIPNPEPDYVAILAECYIHTARYEESKNLFNRYLTICNPKELPAIFTDIASLYNSYKQCSMALDFIDNGLALFPEHESLLIEKAIAYEELFEFEKAEETLTKIININPYQHEIWGLLGSIQFRQNKLTDALSSYEYALAINPDDEQAKLQRAHCLFNLGKFSEAVEPYKEYIEKNPGDDMIISFLAETYENLNDWTNALYLYEQAMAINPDVPVVWIGKACCLHNIGKLDEAYDTICSADEKFPQTLDIIYYRALVEKDIAYETNQELYIIKALNHFTKCLEFDPENTSICYETAIILLQYAEYDHARELLEIAYRKRSSFERIEIFLAIAYYGIGNVELAAKHLNIARETISNTDDIFLSVFPNAISFIKQ
jgi:tetratricopeptide (TPR) repeat protein